MTKRLKTLIASSLTPVCGPEKARGHQPQVIRLSFSPLEGFSLPSLGLAATPLS